MTPPRPTMPEANDPTRSGTPLPASEGARFSCNEIEQLCLKAARGAGMSWGLAEEAGFAAAWLAARGLEGPGALLALLRKSSTRTSHDSGAVFVEGRFRTADVGAVCPIVLGSALCDHARLPEVAIEDAALDGGPVDHPILLLPFLSDLARMQDTGIRMDWLRGSIYLTPGDDLSGDVARLVGESDLEVRLSRDTVAPPEPPVTGEPGILPLATLRGLDELALRTTVPASEVSRAGAGAATEDDD